MALKWGFGGKKERAPGEPTPAPADSQPASDAPPEAAASSPEPAPPGPPATPDIVVLGDGFARSLWETRLRAGALSFVHGKDLTPDDLAGLEFQVLVETDLDPRPTSPLPDAAPRLAAGGIVLLPCYDVAPTHAAAQIGAMAGRAVGYTLFPPPGENDVEPAIELGKALQTEADAFESALRFVEKAGLRPEPVGDVPGLVFARALACLINDAAFALGEGVASAEDIDQAMQLGVNYPKGLLAWCDEIGADLAIRILDGLQLHYGEDRYRVAPLLRAMHAADRKFFPPNRPDA